MQFLTDHLCFAVDLKLFIDLFDMIPYGFHRNFIFLGNQFVAQPIDQSLYDLIQHPRCIELVAEAAERASTGMSAEEFVPVIAPELRRIAGRAFE